MARRATGRVIGLGFSVDGKMLATTSDDGSVSVWDVASASQRETFAGHAGAAVGPTFSRDGTTLFSASDDGSVFVWDVYGARRLGRPFRFSPVAQPGAGAHAAGQGASTAVAVSPDSSLFATSPAPNRVTVWRARDLSVVGELRGPCGPVVSLAWSHDGRRLAATGNAPQTVEWNVQSRKIVKLFGPAGELGSAGVNFSPDDKLIGMAGVDGTLRLYDARTGRRLVKLPAKGTLQDLDFSSDGQRVASAGLTGDILIWNVMRQRLERTIHHGSAFLSIRFSPDGKEIATGDFAGSVDFWDAASGRHVGRALGEQNGYVLSVTYSPSGDEVVTTSTDGQFRLWDLTSGKLVGGPLPGAETGGWGTFFPNGKQVIGVFPSGAGVVWNVDPAAWKRRACQVANRDLTQSEWRNVLPQRRYRRVCP
jgi:WD40 repeat protein